MVRYGVFQRYRRKIAVEDARRIGFFNEVFPKDELLPRASAIAENLLKIAPITHRYIRQMSMKRMKTLINENVPFDMGLEGLSIMATMAGR
jgi:enoyl-CoA hydratase/carnithine racemase